MIKKELLYLISETERTLRINSEYILGTSLSKEKYKELRKEYINLEVFNHFEVNNLLNTVFYYRNFLLHGNTKINEVYLCKKYYKFFYDKNDYRNYASEKDLLNIIYIFIHEDVYIDKTTVLKKNKLTNYKYDLTRYEFFNSHYEEVFIIKSDNDRRLRNYIFHGYHKGEINSDGFVF